MWHFHFTAFPPWLSWRRKRDLEGGHELSEIHLGSPFARVCHLAAKGLGNAGNVWWSLLFLSWSLFAIQFSCSVMSDSLRHDPMDCSMPGFPVHHQPVMLAQTDVCWVGDAIQTSHPLLYPSPPAFNLSQHQGLSSESVLCIKWPKYWSFSFSISPSNE